MSKPKKSGLETPRKESSAKVAASPDNQNAVNAPDEVTTPAKSAVAAAELGQPTGNSNADVQTNPPAKDPVFEKYGDPFVVDDKGKIHLNERAVAVKCATVHLIRYDPVLKFYERYDRERGLWTPNHQVEVLRLLGDLLSVLGEQFKFKEFVDRIKTSHLNSLSKMLQPYQADVALEDTTGLVHVKNGVLDLRGAESKLLKHDPKYLFRSSPCIKYDTEAKCPKFRQLLLEKALDVDDIKLAQKYLGSPLLGNNTCQGILLLRGTPGGGKSTLVNVIEAILGQSKVAHLRTKHLNGRFETSAFIGKRVLVGKDVPGDTLVEKGARMLKSLVGGDEQQAEIKYNPTKQSIRGDYHVIITSNNRLRIAVEGDEEAWRRRLLIVDFELPKTSRPIPDFDKKLVAEEASGILNWLIEGALAYREEMDKKGKLELTKKQSERVSSLLDNSDSMRSFVNQRITKNAMRDVSSEELLISYFSHCKKQDWTPVPSRKFQTSVSDLLGVSFEVFPRHDIKRENKCVRGFKGIELN